MINLQRILPSHRTARMAAAIAITVAITGALSLIIIYEFKTYGLALFILIPLLIGFCATTLYYYKRNVPKSHQAPFLSLLAVYLCFLFSSVEGLICIAMSLPFALLLTWIGSEISYLVRKRIDKPQILLLILILSFRLQLLSKKTTRPISTRFPPQ